MSRVYDLAACIASGQVAATDIERLCKENPGLGWVLQNQRAAYHAQAGVTGREVLSPPPHQAGLLSRHKLTSNEGGLVGALRKLIAAARERRIARRRERAATIIAMGRDTVAVGEKAGDARVIADGKALIAQGWGTLERIGIKP